MALHSHLSCLFNRSMSEINKKHKRYLVAALILMVAAFGVSLCVGRYKMSVIDFWQRDEDVMRIFLTLRLPRTIVALVAGFGLAVAGAVYQIVFRNALASPDIIGVSSGASAGAAVAILYFGGGSLITAICAFGGGLAAVFIALILAGAARQKQLATFVLSGIAVNALAQAILMCLKLTADPERQLASIEYWTMGSLSSITSYKIPVVLIVCAFGLGGLFLLHRQIVLLALDADEAKMLGVSVEVLRAGVLVLATMVVSAIVSVTGLISFIGLIAPHLARLLTKNNKASTLLLGGVIGAVLLLMADSASRSVFTSEIPISILTSLIGAPFLIYLVCREERVP